MAESLYDLLPLDQFVDQSRLLSAHDRLFPEIAVSTLCDKSGGKQTERSQDYDDQRDRQVQVQHDPQGAEDRQHTAEQLGEAHQQSVGERVHVGDDAADQISGGMGVQVGKRQLLDLPDR